jgi:PAS domain-containing protein
MAQTPRTRSWSSLRCPQLVLTPGVLPADNNLAARVGNVRYGLAGNRSTEPSADSVEQRYESLFEMAPAGLIFADLDGRMIRANGRAAAVFGCTPAELEGRLVSDFYPELPSGKPLAFASGGKPGRPSTTTSTRFDGPMGDSAGSGCPSSR